MKKSVKKMWDFVGKQFEKGELYEKRKEESLQPFYKIMEESISKEEKLKKIYKEQLKTIFIYGKVEKRKGNKEVFIIDSVIKQNKDKIFDELIGIEYEIKGDVK